ncbi:MAG: hypothetical protein KDD50_13025 [Bdellovibrionales bacterium]|nr:hypothetical protein [Bdellovibrionales bacterium]
MKKSSYQIIKSLFVLMFLLFSANAWSLQSHCDAEGNCAYCKVNVCNDCDIDKTVEKQCDFYDAGNEHVLRVTQTFSGKVAEVDPRVTPVLQTADLRYQMKKEDEGCEGSHSGVYLSPEEMLYNNGKFIKTTIVGKDERRCADSRDPKFIDEQVGMVEAYDESTGLGNWFSSFVTGENCDVLVTSAHLVYDFKKGRVDPYYNKGKVTYTPAAGDRQGIRDGVIVDSSFKDKRVFGVETKHDWMVVRLNQPLKNGCVKNVLPAQSSKCEGSLVLGAYHEDIINCVAISERSGRNQDGSPKYCRQTEYDASKGWFKHDCDTKDRSSGAPIFCKGSDGELSWIGINDGSSVPTKSYKEPSKGGAGFGYSSSNHYNRGTAFHKEFRDALNKELVLSKARAR